jgi:Flp pilus assembly protein TadD/TolB-like protein
MTLPAGTTLGVYEILEPLGAGGMGEVYRARDRKLGREVAIKVLPDEFASDPGRVSRFEREARMLAAVNHPTIAAIYGAEEDGATRYIVMELVEGDTLAQRLSTGALPVADSLRYASQIAEALEVAHEKGVIHRDLKPANIKITPGGKVKVLDFGLAKAMELPYSGDMSRSPTLVMEESRPGEIVGTPEFMAPEQARGKETDRRTDIWAFGCILFECLTGTRAFTGETIPDVVTAILSQEPDWSALPARTPPRIRELLARCLEKDPGRRLRDAGDARLETEAALAGFSSSGAAMPAVRGPVARWKIAVALVVVAGVAAATLLLLRPKSVTDSGKVQRLLAVLPFRNLTGTEEGHVIGLGMAETVSVRLANVPGLQVVTPRATVEAAGDADPNFARVAKRLGANTLLAGTLQRENERFRITYRIVDESGNQLAASAIDGSELFALQDRVADSVVHDLRLRRGAVQRTPTPSGLDTVADQERYIQAVGLLQRYDKRKGVEQAVQILQKLSEEKPSSAIVKAALGRACLAMWDFTRDRTWADRAIAASDAARALDSGLPEVDVTLGETLLATGRSKEAIEAFRRALAANPDRVDVLLGIGRAAEAAGDNALAESSLRRAVTLQPGFASFNQLGAFYADQGRWQESTDAFQRATQLWPDSPRAWGNLGGAAVGRCDFGRALEAFRKALELEPKDSVAASNLGVTQLWMGQFKDSVTSLERAASASPNDFRIWVNVADARRGAGDAAGAVAAYEKCISLAREQLRLNPEDSEAHAAVATGLAKTGKAEQASHEIRAAIALREPDANLLADAAVVAAAGGRRDEALDWMAKAIAAGYCREALAQQPELASLREDPKFKSIIAAPRKTAGS